MVKGPHNRAFFFEDLRLADALARGGRKGFGA